MSMWLCWLWMTSTLLFTMFESTNSIIWSRHAIMALVQQNILTAFQELGASVSSVLRTHLGNTTRLDDQKRSCLQFLANIQQVFFSSKFIWLTDHSCLAFSAHEPCQYPHNHDQHWRHGQCAGIQHCHYTLSSWRPSYHTFQHHSFWPTRPTLHWY